MLAFILLYLVLSLMSSRVFVHLFCLVRIENEDSKEKKTVSWELGLKAEWLRLCFFFEVFQTRHTMQTVLADRVALEKNGEKNWVLILPTIFAFVFLFVLFLPLSGWVSGVAGIDKSWITLISVLVSSAVSILALFATYFGGKLLPRLLYANTTER
jgi:hypothetical protein